jgi:hypothetical protein
MFHCTRIIQHGIQLEKSPISNSTMAIVGKWLKECEDNHPSCGSSEVSSQFSNGERPLPTRLIQVHGGQSSQIRIVDGAGRFGRYLALSHRWVGGAIPDWTTQQATVEERHSWFSVQSLPASIVDAVEVTRRLKVDYLWIDSICIIQDSNQDWNCEASKMANVYANALFTIFADQAKDDNQGFLSARQIFPVTLVNIRRNNDAPITAYLRKSSPDSYKIENQSIFASDTIDLSHLSKRAWILQERVLSPRKLHFGAHKVYWACRKTTFAEDGHPVDQRTHRWMTDIHKLMESESISKYEFHETWSKLVEVYCTLELTYTEDRLPALAGVAKMLSQKSKYEYIAGLWIQTIAAGLAWQVKEKDPDKLSQRPSRYRAPSFSWACVDEEISYIQRGDEEKPDTSGLTVMSSNIEFEFGDGLGKIKGGKITVSGLVRRAVNLGLLPTQWRYYKGHHPLYDEDWTPFGVLRNDSKDDIDVHEMTCLRLLEKGGTEFFLVLIPVAPDDPVSTTYRRVGLGMTGVPSLSEWLRDDPKFFDGAERKTITLL